MSDANIDVTIRIEFSDGNTTEISLSPKTPVSIGRHRNNDVQINEKGVATLHCKIGWTSKGAKLIAGTSKGVLINDQPVNSVLLSSADTIKIGSATLTVSGNSIPDKSSVGSLGEVGLKSNTQEIEGKKVVSSPPKETKPSKPAAPESALSAILDDDDFFEDEEPETSMSDNPPLAAPLSEDADSLDEEGPTTESTSESAPRSARSDRRRSRAVRPGEQQVFKSKSIMSMAIGSVILIVTVVVFYFLIGFDRAQRSYDEAMSYYNEKQYAQAEKAFNKFLQDFPKDSRVEEIKLTQGKARIERHTQGAVGNWQKALDAFSNFVADNRSTEGFVIDQRPLLGKYVLQITEGALKATMATKERSMLEIALAARKKVAAYGPENEIELGELNKSLDQKFREAESAVLKQEVFDDHKARVNEALEQKKPLVALDIRKALLTRYPELANDKDINKLMVKILETEKSLVSSQELDIDALTEEREVPFAKPLTLAVHTRSQTAGDSENEVVLVQSSNSCFGIDTITGKPVWQRVIGFNSPFFPIQLTSSPESVLMFDTLHHELLNVTLQSGKLIWRLPIRTENDEPEALMGPPLIHESQIIITTDHNNLYKLDMLSGHLTARLHFNQPLQAPPALTADEEHCLIAGERELFYHLSLRPLSCNAVAYYGHDKGAIDTPLLAMGGLMLLTENQGANACRLSVLNTQFGNDGMQVPTTLAPTNAQMIEGRVVNPPILRGKQLIVHSTGRRLTAFTVSDEPGTDPLTIDANFQAQKEDIVDTGSAVAANEAESFMYVGPNGQIWFVNRALRKLQLNSDHFQLDPRKTASGQPSQPLQMKQERVYIGRRQPYSSAIYFSQANRQELVSFWRTILGARVIQMTHSDENRLVCLTDTGTVYQISPAELKEGGFLTDALQDLRLDTQDQVADTPLNSLRLSDGKILAYWGEKKPALRLLSTSGQVRSYMLSSPIEAQPLQIDAGIVLPAAEELILLPNSGSRLNSSPFDTPDAKWKWLCNLGNNNFIGINSQGQVARYQYAKGTPSHFKQLTKLELRSPVDVSAAQLDEKIIVATAKGELVFIDGMTLEIKHTLALPAAASQNIWTIHPTTVIVQAAGKLILVKAEDKLEILWESELKGGDIPQQPLITQDSIIAVDHSGDILQFSLADGTVKPMGHLNQPLSMPLYKFGNDILGTTVDGSIYRFNTFTQPATSNEQ